MELTRDGEPSELLQEHSLYQTEGHRTVLITLFVAGQSFQSVLAWALVCRITDGMDDLIVKPRSYLGDGWAEINEVVRSLGGHWMKGQTKRDGSWRIPK